jgi:tetratricopeptide (TPR) repeat protein
MARAAPRTRDDYFDQDLCDLVDGLFKAASGMELNGRFPFHGYGRSRSMAKTTMVLDVFNIRKNDVSCWRFQKWVGGSADKPLSFGHELLSVFDGSGVARDPELAEAVRRYWRTKCGDKLDRAIAGLKAHKNGLEEARRRRALEPPAGREVPDRDMPPRKPVPAFLAPPSFQDAIPRESVMSAVAALAQSHFCLVIEGPAGAGKSRLARAFADTSARREEVLWLRLEPLSTLHDIGVRLACMGYAPDPLADGAGFPLVDWLVSSDSLLVLDGLDAGNQFALAPLLQQVGDMDGPARLVITATTRGGGANSFELPPLTRPEMEAILTRADLPFDPDAVTAAAAVGMTPAALLMAARSQGRLDLGAVEAATVERENLLAATVPRLLQPAVEALRIIADDFDLETLQQVLDATDAALPARTAARDLERERVISPASASTWRLDVPQHADLRLPTPFLLEAKALVRLADHFEGRSAPDTRNPSLEDCLALYTACRLLQAGGLNPPRRASLLRKFTQGLVAHGEFRKVAACYRAEIALGQRIDRWWDFRLAYVYRVVGRYADAVGILTSAIHRSLQTRNRRDEGLHLSLIRLLAEVLVETGEPLPALKILDRAIRTANVSGIGSTICMQTVAALSWALVKAGEGAASLLVDQEILGRQFSQLSPEFTKQVSNVRAGLTHQLAGRLAESEATLAEARAFFAGRDARAFAWSSMHLAVTLDRLGRHGEAGTALEAAIHMHAANDLFSGEMAETYAAFLAAGPYDHLRALLEVEQQRIAAREAGRLQLAGELQQSRLVEHVLLDLGGRLEDAYDFDLESYVIFSLGEPFAVSSKFARNLMNQLRSDDPERTLDLIFEATPLRRLFATHLYNKLISLACGDSHVLANKYILPHLSLIGRQPDSVIYFYARTLEGVGQTDAALELLEQARERNCFEYFNIKANCLARSDPVEALRQNNSAYGLAQDQQQRAQILNNKAAVVCGADIRFLYDEAIEWCEQALRLVRKPGFRWPQHTLLKLQLKRSGLRGVSEVIANHRERFGTTSQGVKKIIEELTESRLRAAALQALSATQSR